MLTYFVVCTLFYSFALVMEIFHFRRKLNAEFLLVIPLCYIPILNVFALYALLEEAGVIWWLINGVKTKWKY